MFPYLMKCRFIKAQILMYTTAQLVVKLLMHVQNRDIASQRITSSSARTHVLNRANSTAMLEEARILHGSPFCGHTARACLDGSIRG
jgi:hypothetical protein